MKRLFVVAVLLSSCFIDSTEPEPEFRTHHVITRFAVDPVSELGAAIDMNEELFEELFAALLRLTCDGDIPVIAELRSAEMGESAGQMGLYISSPPATGPDPCSGSARFLLLGNPLVSGPLYVEGDSAEARLPIEELFPDLVAFTSEWVRVDLEGDPEGLTGGTLFGLTQPAALITNTSPEFEPQSTLDILHQQGFRPDFDADEDGLEHFVDEDEDGLIDACIDGDGTVIPGRDCVNTDEIADAYELRILFRVVDAEIVNR